MQKWSPYPNILHNILSKKYFYPNNTTVDILYIYIKIGINFPIFHLFEKCGVTVMFVFPIKWNWLNRLYSSAHIFNNIFVLIVCLSLCLCLSLASALLDCFWGDHRDPPDPVPGAVPATWQPDPESPHQHHLLGLRGLHAAPGHLRGQVRVKYTLYRIILYIGYVGMLLDEKYYRNFRTISRSFFPHFAILRLI